MPDGRIHILTPREIADGLGGTRLEAALHGVADLAKCRLTLAGADGGGYALGPAATEAAVRYREQPRGKVSCDGLDQELGAHATNTLAALLEHSLEREVAVADLAEALVTSYEELNVL